MAQRPAADSSAPAAIPELLRRSGLPEAQPQDLPPPRPWLHLVGPGTVMVATSLGSGEILFWPGITMENGFSFIWAALAALSLQYVLNTEIARYTLLTGESVVTGFARLWRPLAWVFLAGSTFPWIWPGWSTGGATALSWVTGGEPLTIAVISLIVIGVVLSSSRAAYKALETIQLMGVVFLILVIAAVAVAVVRGPSVEALLVGMRTVPAMPEGIPIAVVISALAFCGAGGSVNLTTSLWIRDKGFGMGFHIPRIQSPVTGQIEAKASVGYFPTLTETNLLRWRGWWRESRREQFVTFFVTGAAGLIVLMLIAHATLHGQGLGIGMDMLLAEGRVIGEAASGTLETLFYLMVAVVFFTSAVGVLDHVARLSADILKTNSEKLRTGTGTWSAESSLYFLVLWGMIAFALVVLLVMDIRQTPTLLSIAGSLSGVVMFLYSTLLPILHWRLYRDTAAAFPKVGERNPFLLPVWRRVALVGASLFYGYFSVLLVMGMW